MPNHLQNETSPYLRQHANNPVDWYPWGDVALNKARRENKPVFLSIGYAACHWCHVMAHESFENLTTADLLNKYFVCIKVDREERPDLDSIYMSAVVALTQQGGWPLSVFLTPEGEPFYGGTYFPPEPKYGMPGFPQLLMALHRAWQTQQGEIRQQSAELVQQVRNSLQAEISPEGQIRPEIAQTAMRTLLNQYDGRHGGWGQAPRFPQPMALEFLLMRATRKDEPFAKECLQMVSHALFAMSRGGMYDVVGSGFHRYSTDNNWLVPHFEKMLYDNAQLALVYLHAYQLTGEISFRQVCQETLDFVLREMTDPQGGFYSSLDADSEGEEGKYYLWDVEQLRDALSKEEYEWMEKTYFLNIRGNFEGKLILQRRDRPFALAHEADVSAEEWFAHTNQIHQKLYAIREQRVRPATDDKVLVSWNALAMRALAEAGRVLNRADYLAAAQKNADFLLTAMVKRGRLLRAWRAGEAHHAAYLEDYAGLVLGLLVLYQSDFNPRWMQQATAWADKMNRAFADEAGGFFDTRIDASTLIARPKEIQDNAVPSGNALAALALLQLAALDENAQSDQPEQMLAALETQMSQYPTAFGMNLQALDFALGPVQQVAILTPSDLSEAGEFLTEFWKTYRPHTVVAVTPASASRKGLPGLLRGRTVLRGNPTAFVCESFTCKLPVTDLSDFITQLNS